LQSGVQPREWRGQKQDLLVLSHGTSSAWGRDAELNLHQGAMWASGSSDVLCVTGTVCINYKKSPYKGILRQKCW
jgi:hypothetical protein